MRLIAQPNHTSALLIDEETRMALANELALSASWLDDHKGHFGEVNIESTAGALAVKLHQIAHKLAANRAGEIYDTEDEVEFDLSPRPA